MFQIVKTTPPPPSGGRPTPPPPSGRPAPPGGAPAAEAAPSEPKFTLRMYLFFLLGRVVTTRVLTPSLQRMWLLRETPMISTLISL